MIDLLLFLIDLTAMLLNKFIVSFNLSLVKVKFFYDEIFGLHPSSDGGGAGLPSTKKTIRAMFNTIRAATRIVKSRVLLIVQMVCG